MALYRLEARIIGRSAGQRADGARAYRNGSAAAASAYRRGARTTSMTKEGFRAHDYSKKRGVIHTETLVPEGAPAWATNSEQLWQMVETAEKRKDSQLARELLVTLPHDVPLSACLTALRDWLQREAVALDMVADIAVHGYGTPLDPNQPRQAARIAELHRAGVALRPLEAGDLLRDMPPDGNHAWQLPDGKVLAYQPHAHVMLTMRDIGPGGFGPKRRDWNTRSQVQRWRETWEQTYNDLLASVDSPERISAKARWKQEADDRKQPGLSTKPGLSPRALRRQLNLDGGFYAALGGRPPKQTYGDMPMTAFDWNETQRDLRRREDEAEKKLAAANSRGTGASDDRQALVKALVRIAELVSCGVIFKASSNGHIEVGGERKHLTVADQKLFLKHEADLVQVLQAAPHMAMPPKIDGKLAEALVLVEQLQSEGIRFFRTDKGTLGYEPRGAISPGTYRQFSGMHQAILAELDRREHVALCREAQAQAAAKDKLLRNSEEEAQRLKLSLKAERHQRASLERGAAALIESASTGTEWPGAGDESPLLTRLRNTFNGVRRRMVGERQRADKLERALTRLKKRFIAFVGYLVRKYPADEAEIQAAGDQVLGDVATMKPPSQPAKEGPTERYRVKPRELRQAPQTSPDRERVTPPAKSRLHSDAPKNEPGVRPKNRRKGYELE